MGNYRSGDLRRFNYGFLVLLRESEIRAIRRRDILLGVGNGRHFVALFIRQSETERGKRGNFRTLYGAASSIWPA